MKRVLLITAGVIAVVVFAGPLLLVRVSNCGGNSAALSAVRDAELMMQLATDDSNGRFSINRLNSDERKKLARSGRHHWIPSAKILALGAPAILSPTNQTIVVVCDTAYNNVPQPAIWNLWRRTPAHAVARANGETALLSPKEFGQLNLAAFVDLASLSGTTNR